MLLLLLFCIQNTPESLQYSMDVHKTCKSIKDQRMGRYFIAMLAFNQNQFELALTLADDGDHMLANNIKLLAMTKLNDWAGVCDLLYKIKTNRSVNGTRYRVTTDVVSSTYTETSSRGLCVDSSKSKLCDSVDS